jgi:hypothetical protein
VKGKVRRCQYHFLDADEQHVVLAFDAGADPQITLERPLAEEDHPDATGETVEYDDTEFRRKDTIEASAFCIGGIPGEKGAAADCSFFEDEDEMEVLVREDWGGYVEIRRGEVIHENELVVKRQRDEDDWDIKPPPRIDLRSLNESRRAKQLAEREEKQREEEDALASAREKLAAFHDEAPGDEDEDAVSLSEIVDLQFRFGECPAEDPTPEETELPPVESESVPTSDDPFRSVFEEEPPGEDAEYTPDPYQAYMEEERETDFSEAIDGEDTPPELSTDPLFRSGDGPREFLTEDTTDDFLNAGVYDEDEDEV